MIIMDGHFIFTVCASMSDSGGAERQLGGSTDSQMLTDTCHALMWHKFCMLGAFCATYCRLRLCTCRCVSH